MGSVDGEFWFRVPIFNPKVTAGYRFHRKNCVSLFSIRFYNQTINTAQTNLHSVNEEVDDTLLFYVNHPKTMFNTFYFDRKATFSSIIIMKHFVRYKVSGIWRKRL